jgi:hypothetical protein
MAASGALAASVWVLSDRPVSPPRREASRNSFVLAGFEELADKEHVPVLRQFPVTHLAVLQTD